MFLFIAGVEQKAGELVKKGVSRCVKCGSDTDLVNCDNVLTLFFLPVWRWPAKHSLLYCPHCKLLFPPTPMPISDHIPCSSCTRLLPPHYRFCPFCGVSL